MRGQVGDAVVKSDEESLIVEVRAPHPSPPKEQSLEQPPADCCCILGRPGTAQRSFLPAPSLFFRISYAYIHRKNHIYKVSQITVHLCTVHAYVHKVITYT